MKKRNINELICEAWVFGSHEDFSVVEDIWAGFDTDHNLIILCERTDYDKNKRCNVAELVMDKDEAYRLATRIKVPLKCLPEEISAAMAEWNTLTCPDICDVRDCFKEIAESLLDEGCHFTL